VLLLYKLELETKGQSNLFTAPVFPAKHLEPFNTSSVGFQAVDVNSASGDSNVNVHLYSSKFNYGSAVKP